MRISDWSSDVCSSDLRWGGDRATVPSAAAATDRAGVCAHGGGRGHAVGRCVLHLQPESRAVIAFILARPWLLKVIGLAIVVAFIVLSIFRWRAALIANGQAAERMFQLADEAAASKEWAKNRPDVAPHAAQNDT